MHSALGRRLGAIVFSTVLGALWVSGADAEVVDYGKYPDLHGQWVRWGPSGADLTGPLVRNGPPGFNSTRFDPSKPPGLAQHPPLTPAFEAAFEANIKDQREGGQGTTPTFTCVSPGMPRATNGYGEYEFVVTPNTTYILLQHINDDRRIFTDGREFPANLEPTFMGYSIGRWVDTKGTGRYDLLEVETRGPFKSPRSFDSSGALLHPDGETIVKEKIYLDAANLNLLHNDVTVIDHALIHPWTVHKAYGRELNTPQPVWAEINCGESNNHIKIGNEGYMLSADGYLMPAKKDQAPPDLRYFKQSPK
jgi:hypothetical protein